MRLVRTNESDLVKGLKNGDPKSYSKLVDYYHHQLCAYAFGLIGDTDQSEDIVQNVFIKVWNNRKKIKDDINLANYLYKSVYNGFIDQYRKMRPVFSLEKIQIENLSTFAEEDLTDNSLEKLISQVKKEIEKLPPKCKQTFLLSKQEGLTNIEIAEFLNISVKAVEGHITKAFSILRKSFDNKTTSILFLIYPAQHS